jgi:hypothetical protein
MDDDFYLCAYSSLCWRIEDVAMTITAFQIQEPVLLSANWQSNRLHVYTLEHEYARVIVCLSV